MRNGLVVGWTNERSGKGIWEKGRIEIGVQKDKENEERMRNQDTK
jgi:hypothetical protein